MSTLPIQHILGAGAVGHLVSCYQTSAEFPTVLFGRRAQTQPYIVQLQSQQASMNLELDYETQTDASISHLWLAVKSYQVETALAAIAPNLHSDSIVLLMQNGMGHLEIAMKALKQVIPPENIYIAINTHGALLDTNTNPVSISHTGQGKFRIGRNYLCTSDNTLRPAILSLISAQLNPEWDENIEQALWLKLGINSVINPLTALYQCRNGDLITHKDLYAQVEDLIAELETFYRMIGYDNLALEFSQRCHSVIKSTGENYSSMMLDVKHKRPTELEAITGYLLSRADGVRLVMKSHRSLYHRLQKN